MSEGAGNPARLRFGPFELDEAGDLRRDGVAVTLAPRPLAVLRLLVEHAGRTVSREEIRRDVWGEERFLEFDQSLNSCIRRLRQALGDDPQSPRYVETMPKRGYRFVAPVERAATGAPGHGAPDVAAPRTAGFRPTPALLVASAVALLVAVSLTVVALFAGRGATRAGLATPGEAPRPLRVAVFDFADRAAGAAPEYLPQALAEEVRARLSRHAPERLAVLARGSVERPGAVASSLLERARELDADGWIEGAVERRAGGLELRAAVVDAASGVQRWSGSLPLAAAGEDRFEAAVGRLSREVAGHLLGAIGVPSADSASVGAAAYEAYLRGRYHHLKGDPPGRQAALEAYREAVAEAPDFALAWGWLSQMLVDDALATPVPDAAKIAEARAAADRALVLDPNLAEARIALGKIALYHDWDAAQAQRQLGQGVAQTPGSASTHSAAAAYLAAVGRTSAAVEAAEHALRLDPLGMAVHADLCWYLLYDDRLPAALEACGRALRYEPGNGWTRLGLAEAQRLSGDPAAAVVSWLELLAQSPAPVDAWRESDGDPESVLTAIFGWLADRHLAAAEAGRIPALQVAASLALAGRTDPAFEWLERAVAARSSFAVFLGVDPRFVALRDDPRFSALVARTGFAVAPPR